MKKANNILNKLSDRFNLIIKSKKLNNKLYSIRHLNNLELEGNNIVYSNTKLDNVKVGMYSYIGENCKIINTSIGRFTSIGNNVKIIIGQHPTSKFISTHPIFYSKNNRYNKSFYIEEVYEEYRFVSKNDGLSLKIGSDVWIGDNVSIMEGVTIGDGAIIAAGALVTKDIEPFAIVKGIPAQVTRYRFEEKTIEKLMEIKWWERDIQWIKSNAYKFNCIESFETI